ncbi:MAG: hypothetical protein U0361_03370 [Nitrospiraceae bacterium]
MSRKPGLNLAGLRLVVLTSLIQPGHAEQAWRAGFDAYLTKPGSATTCCRPFEPCSGLPWPGPGQRTQAFSIDALPHHGMAWRNKVSASHPRRRRHGIHESNNVRMLERLGYQADIVGNGGSLGSIERAQYSAIVMDCRCRPRRRRGRAPHS